MAQVYPITADLEGTIAMLEMPANIRAIADHLKNLVLEYEHGSAEVSEIEGVSMKQYAAVIQDAILYLSNIV